MVYGTHPVYKQNHKDRGELIADSPAYKTFRDLDLVVESARRSLKDFGFDCIAVTGISGLSVGAPLAMKLKKKLCVLRKDDECSHGVPGELIGSVDLDEGVRVLVLDDFFSSGATGRRIAQAVKVNQPHAVVVGGYAYEYDELYTETFFAKIGLT
jgi:adenine/guanine phosphoribosyltransferase-like PRPP-binding protein